MPLTRQQIFDKAIFIARTQKKPCVNERGWNLFHHKKLRSFTGYWIPVDVALDMEVNAMTSEEYVQAFPQLFKITDARFVCDLEYIHDAHNPNEWEHQFERFAEAYHLVYARKETKQCQQQEDLSTRLRAS